MSSLPPDEAVVKEGSFLYDGKVECDVRIVRSPVRYGSGDYEDPPDIQNDLKRETFYIEYGSTTQRGVFTAGGGGFASLAEAMAYAQAAPGIESTLRWKEATKGDT